MTGVADRLHLCQKSASLLRLYARSGKRISSDTTLQTLSPNGAFLDLELRLSVLGGKGGFGSMLRAQGGKMSARKGEENNDSCRDLNGRRLKTVKEAQSLAAYLAAAPAREAALSKAQAEKYAKLEKMLGRKPKDQKDFEEAAGRLDDAGGDLGQGENEDDVGEGPSRLVAVRGKEASSSGVNGGAGGKRGKLEDSKYLVESREAVDKAKSAVALAMAKRKKKEAAAKAATGSSTTKPSSAKVAPAATASAIATPTQAAATTS